MWVKEEREKAGLELNINKSKILASRPMTLWKMEGEKIEAMTHIIFLGSKIMVDSNCSNEIKRCLLLGRKVIINLDSVLKSRDITLMKNVCLVKDMAFPIVRYGCVRGVL